MSDRMAEDRVVAPDFREEDSGETSLRPLQLDEFIGQRGVRENLRVFIEAARGRGDALDHVLFFGPPGLGKTTLAQIVARELGVNFRMTSGPVIARPGDLVTLIMWEAPRDIEALLARYGACHWHAPGKSVSAARS